MNLHDIPARQREPERDLWRDILREMPALEMYHLRTTRQPRFVPGPVMPMTTAGIDWVNEPFEPVYRAVPEHVAILERLDRQYYLFCQAVPDLRDVPDLAIRLSWHDWQVLRHYATWDQLRAAGFPMVEGARHEYRGIPLVIDGPGPW